MSFATTIRIRNMKLYARHGVLAEERTLGGRYEADLEFRYDAGMATAEDNLDAAVDYGAVAKCLQQAVAGAQFALIETVVASALGRLLAEFPRIETATLRLRKLNVPLEQALDYVEVELSIAREDIGG